MDQFLEEVVQKHKRGIENVMYIIANIAWVLLAIYGVMLLQTMTLVLMTEGFSLNTLIFALQVIIPIGLAILIFLRKDRIKTEYEYTFTNGQLDFAMVFNNKKRKALGTMNVRNVEACGMVSSGSFNRYINMQGIKRNNWFLNRDADLLYFYFQKEGSKRIIIIEPSEEMTGLIKHSLSQGVWQVN